MTIAQVNIELSSRCDRQTICGFCGHQDRKTNPNLKFGDMDFALLEAIAGQIQRGCVVSFHRDGDPLVYPRLREALGRRGMDIIGRCTTVTVSVIPNDRDRALQLDSIRAFMALKREEPPQLQLKVVGNVDDLAEYEALGLPIIGRALHNKRVNQNYQSAPTVPELRVCLDFLHRPTIDWQGRVFCCNRLDTTDAGLIGDLRENTFSNIWHGPKRRAMLAAHLAGHRERANALCASCNYWGVPTS